MKAYYVITISSVLLLYSCKKDDNLSKTPPQIPQAVEYDFNDDAIHDFMIEYRWFTWDGINSSGDGISGIISPLHQNLILRKRNEPAFFNQLHDTIQKDVEEPLYWENFQADLVSISNSSANNYLWPNAWGVHTTDSQDQYYLGITIKENENFLIGWLKFNIDKSTGTIQITDKKLSSGNIVIIDK